MNEAYLSTRQVQLRLNVDRTTIYRMLKDGRLKGVKVGRQWRFPQQQIEALLSGWHPSQVEETNETNELLFTELHDLQDVLAEVLAVSLQVVKKSGESLTEISNNCRFCRLIQASRTGNRACQAHWEKLNEGPGGQKYSTCHAGLNYARTPIHLNGVECGLLVAGQFFVQAPDSSSHKTRINGLADRHKINYRSLAEAAAELTILPARHRRFFWGWMEKIAAGFSGSSQKQQNLNQRLKQIAQMCELTLTE
jgi:excisionase family DNA binding protein